MKLLSEIGAWMWAVVSAWYGWVGGSATAGVIGFGQGIGWWGSPPSSVYIVLLVIGFLVSVFGAWHKEYKRAEIEIAKNQEPDIHGRVTVAFSVPGESAVGRPLITDTRLFLFVKLVNHRDVPITINRYQLRMKVGGAERVIAGQPMFNYPVKIFHSAKYTDSTTTNDGFHNLITITPIALRLSANPLRKALGVEGWILFYVTDAVAEPGISWKQDFVVEIEDDLGIPHTIPAPSTDTIQGWAET